MSDNVIPLDDCMSEEDAAKVKASNIVSLLPGGPEPLAYALEMCILDAISSFLEDNQLSFYSVLGAIESAKFNIECEANLPMLIEEE